MLHGPASELNNGLVEKTLDNWNRGYGLSKKKSPGKGEFSRGFTRELRVKNGGFGMASSSTFDI